MGKVITTPEQKAEIARYKYKDKKYGNDGNEKVWNYIVADILANSKYKRHYVNLFCGEDVYMTDLDIWYESEPLPPRYDEGNTKLDLAFGSIRTRGVTRLGIEFDCTAKDSWVCFVEAKFFSDCSTTVSHDTLRNQIIRVIENLLCFQAEGKFPTRLYFTLLTPRIFMDNPRSRLYGYKMEEYKSISSIIDDINIVEFRKRDRGGWSYPDDIEQRAKLLKLNWVCYEDILEKEFGIDGLDITQSKWNEIPGVADYFFDKIKSVILASEASGA